MVQGSSPCAPTNVMIDKCIKCNTKIPDERVHLGYRECVECSSVEAYSAHIVYPHKTGAYVQPVSSETKKNLDRLDRRAVKVGGKISNTSAKEWKFPEPKPQSKPIVKKEKIVFKHKKFSDVFVKCKDIYNQSGYDKSLEFLSELFKTNKINLTTKQNCVNFLTTIHMLNRKQRKLVMK